ncbi:MAG: rod shape-determining protein MreC [Tepidisphaeraceae bacterium]
MPSIRFNHVFTTLLVLGGLCAFVVPARIGDKSRIGVQALFYPVARPVGAVAGWMVGKVAPADARDDGSPGAPRSSGQLIAENNELRVEVANLTGRLDKLREREAELSSVGSIRKLCKVSSITASGGDSVVRESLFISASTRDGVRNGMPVLYTGASGPGIAGRVERAQLGGSLVRLITDADARVGVGFARFQQKPTGGVEFVRIAMAPVLARGVGDGTLVVRDLTLQQVKSAELREGDWIVLEDADWPAALQSYRLGVIVGIKQRRDGAGFAEIRVQPPTNLIGMRGEVMVMVE